MLFGLQCKFNLPLSGAASWRAVSLPLPVSEGGGGAVQRLAAVLRCKGARERQWEWGGHATGKRGRMLGTAAVVTGKIVREREEWVCLHDCYMFYVVLVILYRCLGFYLCIRRCQSKFSLSIVYFHFGVWGCFSAFCIFLNVFTNNL